MKKFRYWLIALVVVLDQAVKAYIRGRMYVGESLPVLKDIFHVTYVQNRGAAFNMMTGAESLLTVLPAALMIFGIWYMEKHKDEHWSLTLAICLIVAGGVGNLIDRLTRGFVTDMLDFRFWPVFNVADVAVCIGAGFLVIYTLFFYGKGKETNNE